MDRLINYVESCINTARFKLPLRLAWLHNEMFLMVFHFSLSGVVVERAGRSKDVMCCLFSRIESLRLQFVKWREGEEKLKRDFDEIGPYHQMSTASLCNDGVVAWYTPSFSTWSRWIHIRSSLNSRHPFHLHIWCLPNRIPALLFYFFLFFLSLRTLFPCVTLSLSLVSPIWFSMNVLIRSSTLKTLVRCCSICFAVSLLSRFPYFVYSFTFLPFWRSFVCACVSTDPRNIDGLFAVHTDGHEGFFLFSFSRPRNLLSVTWASKVHPCLSSKTCVVRLDIQTFPGILLQCLFKFAFLI